MDTVNTVPFEATQVQQCMIQASSSPLAAASPALPDNGKAGASPMPTTTAPIVLDSPEEIPAAQPDISPKPTPDKDQVLGGEDVSCEAVGSGVLSAPRDGAVHGSPTRDDILASEALWLKSVLWNKT